MPRQRQECAGEEGEDRQGHIRAMALHRCVKNSPQRDRHERPPSAPICQPQQPHCSRQFDCRYTHTSFGAAYAEYGRQDTRIVSTSRQRLRKTSSFLRRGLAPEYVYGERYSRKYTGKVQVLGLLPCRPCARNTFEKPRRQRRLRQPQRRKRRPQAMPRVSDASGQVAAVCSASPPLPRRSAAPRLPWCSPQRGNSHHAS